MFFLEIFNSKKELFSYVVELQWLQSKGNIQSIDNNTYFYSLN